MHVQAHPVPVTLRADRGDINRTGRIRGVSSITVETDCGELPVARDPPLVDRLEELDPRIRAVGGLETATDSVGVRAQVSLERGGLRVPGSPDRTLVAGHLGHLVQAQQSLIKPVPIPGLEIR